MAVHRLLHAALIALLLALAVSPARPATCCCTGKLLPAPFSEDACCGGSRSACCMQRAPAPVSAPANLRPAAAYQADGATAHHHAEVRRDSSPPSAIVHVPIASPVAFQRPSLAMLSLLRV